MRTTTSPAPAFQRLRRTARVPALAATLAGALLTGGLLPGLSPAPATATAEAAATDVPVPSEMRISSFNLLGAAHTAPGGSKPAYDSGEQRMVRTVRILDEEEVDVVGFQELEPSQYDKFMSLRGSSFGIYPGQQLGNAARPNSIAWRRDSWELVRARTITTPYLKGRMVQNPVVLLRHVVTGRRAFVLNTHNPADARGPAQHLRDRAVRIQIDEVNELRANRPGVPVFFVGDMNDRERFFCPVTGRTDLRAANGGSNVNGSCVLPRPAKIDWVTGTREVAFSDYEARDDALVNATTDHPVIVATGSIPPR